MELLSKLLKAIGFWIIVISCCIIAICQGFDKRKYSFKISSLKT